MLLKAQGTQENICTLLATTLWHTSLKGCRERHEDLGHNSFAVLAYVCQVIEMIKDRFSKMCQMFCHFVAIAKKFTQQLRCKNCSFKNLNKCQ